MPAEVHPLLIPAFRTPGMEQDPAASPGKIRGWAHAQHTNSHCSSLQVYSLWVSSICPQSHFGGNLPYFYRHLIYCAVPARRAAAPIAAPSRRSRYRGIHQKGFPSRKASAPSCGSIFLGRGGFHPPPANEKALLFPLKEAACFLLATRWVGRILPDV